ncbi:hypothetical protein NMY22_g18988 [Coprinellus aureogranulatus]|nr:hypothetical protein NMY22_g18988 [Coprinellus aureogranulatus]
MTPHRHWIRNYRPHRVAVELADGSVIYSAGVGTVVIDPVMDGKGTASVELTRVLHVPQLHCNLLSCLFLTRCCGFNILIDSTFMHFKRSGMTLFRARITSSNAAFVEGTTQPAVESACAVQTRPLDWQLWHKCLCHHNIADIAKLISGGLAIGISLSSSEKRDPVCEPCLAGKMHSGSFPSTGNRAALPCDLIHSDLCGPMSTSTPDLNTTDVVLSDILSRRSESYGFSVRILVEYPDSTLDGLRQYTHVLRPTLQPSLFLIDPSSGDAPRVRLSSTRRHSYSRSRNITGRTRDAAQNHPVGTLCPKPSCRTYLTPYVSLITRMERGVAGWEKEMTEWEQAANEATPNEAKDSEESEKGEDGRVDVQSDLIHDVHWEVF